MKLRLLLDILPFYDVSQALNELSITGIAIDHRQVSPGDLFVCIQGFSVDGHQFVEQAIARGAVAILAARKLTIKDVPVIVVPEINKTVAMLATKYYDYPTTKFTLIGVTGTNGKTTTTYIIDHIMRQYQVKSAIVGTMGTKMNAHIKEQKNTTPHALFLQETFASMVESGMEVVAMEVSSHALSLGRVYGSAFDIAIYTNMSQDHLDYHQTMANYVRAKTLLFSQLGNHYKDNPKFAVINIDDPYCRQMMESTAQQIITYGVEAPAFITAENIKYSLEETRFILSTPKGRQEITVPLLGKFNVYNILAAVSVAILLHIPLAVIQQALSTLPQIRGRLELIKANQDYTVIIDYAHSPDAITNVLQLLQTLAKRRIIIVIGAGGDRDQQKRPLMAQAALQYSDFVIFTADNPRTEDPQQIIDQMIAGATADHYQIIVDRKQAIMEAVERAETDDIVLIAGKGHETYQEINGKRYDFDDRTIALQAIKQKE